MLIYCNHIFFKVGPQEIYVVGRDDDEVSDDGASWETVDENEVDVLDSNEKVDLICSSLLIIILLFSFFFMFLICMSSFLGN